MLEVYVNSNVKYEKLNDTFFNMNTFSEVISSKVLQNVLEESEGVEYIESGKIVSKYDGNVIGIENISTGVKTLLNIMSFPEIVFYISECGMDIKKSILSLDSGRIYSDSVFLYKKSFKPFVLVYKDKRYLCDTYDKAKKCYDMFMEDFKDEG